MQDLESVLESMQQIEQQKSSTSAGSDAQISSLERKVRALEASLLHQVMLLLLSGQVNTWAKGRLMSPKTDTQAHTCTHIHTQT